MIIEIIGFIILILLIAGGWETLIIWGTILLIPLIGLFLIGWLGLLVYFSIK